jgi:hypothetical protein
LLLLLPVASYAQINCFSGFNAGDNQTWCADEPATLNGGYDFYDETANDSDVGTPALTWVIVSGAGTFSFDGTTGASVSNINFNNTENGTTGFPDVTFMPDAGVTEVVLQLQGSSSAGPCSGVVEVEEVTLYFDPIQDAPLDATVDDDDNPPVQVLDDASGTGNSIVTQTGSELTITIDEGFVIDNGIQFDDVRKYDVSYSGVTGMLGLSGLPAAGQYTQNEFEAAFNEITLVNQACDDFVATLKVFAFYDRTNSGEPAPSGECPGPVTEVAITIGPRDEATASLGANQLLEVCADDEDFTINITGTANTTITYQIDGIPQADLVLDADGLTTIAFDATQYPGAETINIVLTGASFNDGPPCLQTFSKPLQVTIIPLPTLTAELVNSEDEVICNIANGGPTTLPFRLTTNGPAGSYDFTIEEFADDQLVESTDLTRNFTDNGDGTASFTGTLDINGFGGSDIISNAPLTGGEMTYVVDGASFGPTDDGNVTTAECPNDEPDASFTFEIQKESFVEVEINDSEGGTILLQNNSETPDGDAITSADVTFCDGETFTLAVVAPTGNNASPTIPGSVAFVDVQITDADGLLTAASGIYNFMDNGFDINQVLNIPNNQTDDSEFTIVLTPFIDNDGDGLFNYDGSTDDCEGNALTVNVTLRPAPTVTVAPLDPVCEGETVTVVITASEPGTATLTVGQGGAGNTVPIIENDGIFTGEFTSLKLSAGMNQFTVTTFNGDVADCSATVNQMVMVDVEDNPNAAISLDDTDLCDGDEAIVTLTGSEGSETGYDFDIEVTYDGGAIGPANATQTTVSTDAGESTLELSTTDLAEILFGAGSAVAEGTYTVAISRVVNQSTLACDSDVDETEVIVSIEVEGVPAVSCTAPEAPICSGDDYTFTLNADSELTSAIGSSLYYSVVTTTTTFDPTSNQFEDNVSGAEIFEATAAGVEITGTGENMSGFDQTISIEATPFYFNDADGAPEAADFAAACQGEETECSVVVRTMPMATFGGDSQLCEGQTGFQTFTGPPGATFNGFGEDEDGNQFLILSNAQFDAGGSVIVELPGNFVDQDLDFIIRDLTTAEGCTSALEFEFDLNVTPTPEAEFVDTDLTVCEGDSPVIALIGTPNAVVTLTPATLGTVTLDADGNGSVTVTDADADLTLGISGIAITEDDQNGDDFTCTGTSESEFELTVNPAPNGSLVSNRILCVGEPTEVIFNALDAGDYDGLYTIVVNGETYTDVANGDILPIVGLLETTTLFTMTSITQQSAPMCSSLDGTEFATANVIVNQVPTAALDVTIEGTTTTVSDGVNDPFTATICSGDMVDLSLSGTPGMSASGDPLFFEIMVTQDDDDLLEDDVYRVSALDAATLSAELELPASFVNSSETDNAVLSFMITPYYELAPAGPVGFMDVGGLNTNGFVDDFAEAEWEVDESLFATSVSFTTDEMVLEVGGPDFFGADFSGNVSSAITFPEQGFVSFDIAVDLETDAFFNDGVVIDFEGGVIYSIPVQFTGTLFGNFTAEESFSGSVPGGSTLTFEMRTDGSTLGNNRSTLTVSNWFFDPAAQPCPGEKIAAEITVLPALFANFSSAPERVCEGDDATICITGTHDATVTVFLGNGVFNDVKLDDEGNGCFTTVGGLTTDSEFLIMGLTTLDDMPQCSFTFDAADRPAATVMVVPTPTAMISLEPTTVCADDEAIAMVTGTPNATVTYEYNNSPAGTVHLDEDGKGSITLNTENTGTANVVCHVVLTGISVAVGEATCTNELTDHVTLTVRPLPAGTISAGPAVCADGQGTLFFTADPDLLGDYSIEVEDPNGVTLTLTGTSGGAFLTTDIAGTYTLLSITDGTGTDIGCTRTGENLGAAEIIIEEKPNLTAAITGTVGTAHLDSDDEVFNTFRALACDEATINVDFGTSTPSAQALGDLMVNVEVLANDESQANVGSVGTSVIPYTDLNGTNFLDGVLENIADAGITSVEVVLTPFFENGGAAGALEVGEDCSGGTLSFFIDITPAVTLEIEKASSTLVVCEGDAVSIALTGSPNAEVSFSSTGITLDEAFEDGMIDLDGAGNATITGTADGAGMASVTIDMVMVTTIKPEFGISRQCMLMDADEVDITINEVPEAELSVEPAGPICNGETVDVIVTLVNTTSDAGDLFTFVVDGVTYEDIAVDEDGKATLFTSDDLTVTTSFELTSVTNQATDCSNTSDPLSMTTVMVEEVPAGEVTVTIEGEVTTVSEGVSAEFQICANERVDVAASDTNDAHPLVGEDYVSVDFSISEDIDFFSLGQSGTVALPIGDFEAQFSREYNMISGNQVTIELAVTYYNETDGPEGATLDSDECVGITDNITIVINPNPKTEDVMTMTCSGVALDYDLDAAITNGVEDATFSYTVASDDVDVSGLDRTVASDANVTDVFDNFSDDVYTIVYTVTPFGTDGEEDCQGNDFTLTVTVNPEPVITAEQMTMACSGDETACIIRTDNFDTGNISSGEPLSDVIFTLVDVAYSEDFSENFGPVLNEDGESDNAMVGDEGDWLLIAADAFFNTTSENVTVTYTISPVSSEEDGSCAGEEETIVVVIKPEAVVANTLIKVCSNNIFEIDIIEELTANGVGDVISFERRSLDGQNGTLAAYDRGEDFDTEGFAAAGRYNFFGPNGEASNGFNGEALTFNDGVIRDSLVNFIDNGPVDIFYDITIANGTDGTGEVCEGNSFVLRVQVLAPREATLSLADGTSAICAGMPIQLNTSFNGTGTPTYEYDVIDADDGVEITLVASASGGEVSVDGTGEGNATILVMVTDDLGCVAMGTRVVSVGNPPEVMEIEGPSAPCTGTTSFYDVANTDGSTYEWSLSDPTAGTFIPDNTTASVDIVFSAGAGPVTLSVTETNALGCSTTSTVEVSPVDQTFSDYTFELEEGTRTVAFTEAAGGSIEGYQWMYNDGTDDVIISNDPNPTFTFPGTEDSYEVTLMVAGGCTVSADGIATITKTVSLNPDLVQDVIQLERGTNFISFDVEFSDRNMNMVFSGVQGLQSVSTFEGGAAKLYEPSRPPFANSLKTVKDDYGYVVVVDQAQTMTVSGLPLSPSYQRPLDDGINYVGHSGPGSTSSDDRLSDMESAGELVVARTFGRNLANLPAPDNRLTQSYVPNRPVFAQSLKNFYNGIGYSVVTNAVVDGEARETESESYDFVFGTVEGVDLDAPVEILDASGNVVGTIITNPDGTFAATPLYGKVERPDGSIVGAFDLDEAVSFRYGDQVINSDVVFRGEFGGQRIDLNFGETETSVSAPELTTSVFPNPAGQQATVSIITTEEMNLQVVAMDIQGRVVTTLMSNQKVPAGTTSIDWMGISELPAGIYHVVFTSDGVMLSQATQRVIKR